MPPIPGSCLDRLESTLERTDKGFDVDLRTPLFAREVKREEIVEAMVQEVGFTDFEELTDVDHTEMEKIGPFSLFAPYSKRRVNLQKYWSQSFNPDEEALARAVSNVRSLVPLLSLRVASFNSAFAMMPKDTSLGFPWLTSDRQYVEEYLERAQHIMSPDDIYPCMLYTRGQASGPHETKTRDVWGFDHAETILGATVLYPTLNALRARRGFSAWLGDVYVDEALTSLLNQAQGRSVISMDYSGFDSSLSKGLLDVVDDILSSWFQEPGSSRIFLLGMISNTVPIVVPWEVLSGRNGGMPSGSVLTNLRDTIVNLVAGEYVGVRCNSSLANFEVLGDDSVFVFHNDMDIGNLETITRELGLETNPTKQFISRTGCHYLQRWHSLDYQVDGVSRGCRSPYRAISGMLSYERRRSGWNKYLDSARWIMQSENVKNDPRFERFVKWWSSGDGVLSSGIDPSEIFKRAGGAEVIRSTLNIASFPFNVQNPERVNEFETTRILRED
jgi:hypothetical protein